MNYLLYIFIGIIFYLGICMLYTKVSRGLDKKKLHKQLRKFIHCAFLPALVLALGGVTSLSPSLLITVAIGLLWLATYPVLHYLSNYKTGNDFAFHMDFVFGGYIIAWLLSLKLLVGYFGVPQALAAIGVIEFGLLLIPLIEWGYYFYYGVVVDSNNMATIQATYAIEALEYYRSLPLAIQLVLLPSEILLGILVIYADLHNQIPAALGGLEAKLLMVIFIWSSIYLWPRKRAVWVRTGVVKLWLDTRNLMKENEKYITGKEAILKDLLVKELHPEDKGPKTIMLVIGESESRDYMRAFGYKPEETTPWLSEMKASGNFYLFKNSYSCHFQTVPVLTNALTEANQYNGEQFKDSLSFVDMAKQLGYEVHWFSNQSYIGSADTPVTMVAKGADEAAWVKHDFNKLDFDGSLLDYLPTIDPKKNNFLVFHLKGSHFNYYNRYPQDFAKFSKPGVFDVIPNYLDSVRYTDYILQKLFTYAEEKLNLQAMVYFSDHAMEPDQKRSPVFSSFAATRIPMFVYVSDRYKAIHKEIVAGLEQNVDKYFTNDLSYDLLCSIMDIESNRFDKNNSIASVTYKYKLEDLKTELGKRFIKDDPVIKENL